MTFDVFTTIRIRINAPDQRSAENTVLTLLSNAQGGMLDCPAVVQTGIALTPDNPRSEAAPNRPWIRRKEERGDKP